MRKRSLCSVILLATLAGLGGCGTAPIPLSLPDEDREAKRFVPPPDKAAIYVYRDTELGGFPLMVVLDGRSAGWTYPGHYLLLEVSPGPHLLLSLPGANVASLGIDTEAGGLYYVSQESVPQFWGESLLFPPTALYRVDGERGRERVLQSKRLAAGDWPEGPCGAGTRDGCRD